MGGSDTGLGGSSLGSSESLMGSAFTVVVSIKCGIGGDDGVMGEAGGVHGSIAHSSSGDGSRRFLGSSRRYFSIS